QRGVGRSAAPADEIRGDDRLAVSRREGVSCAPEESRRQRGDDDERAQVTPRDEAREAGVGDAIGRLERRPAGERGRAGGPRAGGNSGDGRRDVERAPEEI